MDAGSTTSALDVARYLILLAASEEEPEALTLSRLSKLLYCVQGWSLVERGRPLFAEALEAWRLGPVVPAVWAQFDSFGAGALPAQEGACENLAEEDADFIRRVWESYRQFSASGLAEMMSRQAPWQGRWASSSNGATRPISIDDMRRHFAELAR